MTCPKDAYETRDNEKWCRLRIPIGTIPHVCSRPKKHRGKHHAHYPTEKQCIKAWTTEEAVIEAL